MDENELKSMLAAIKAPAPSENAKNQAVTAAFAVFDKNIAANLQGTEEEERPNDIGSTNYVRRFLMRNRSVASSMGSAVALCALVAVLGVPFIYHQMSIVGEGNISRVGGDTAGAKQVVGQEVNDPEYVKKLQEQNKKQSAAAQATGSSFVPTPIAPAENQTLALPATPAGPNAAATKNAPKGDALAEWRAKTEAKRVKMEQEQQPADAGKAGSSQGQPMAVENGEMAQRQAPKKAREERDRRPDDAEANKDMADAVSGVLKEAEAVRAPAVTMTQPSASAPAPMQKAIGGGASVEGRLQMDRMIAVPMPQPEPIIEKKPVVIDLGGYSRASSYYQDQGRDEYPNYEDNSVKSASAEPVSTFSIDVDTSSYSLIRRMINGGQLPPKGAVRLEELLNYFPYSYALPAKNEDPFKPTVAVYNCPWSADHKLMHIGIKGYDLENKPKSNIIFLIDTSGSMNSPDKLPLLISSFKLMLDSLNPDDTIGIVTYAGSAGVALEPTKASEKSKIIAALDRLSAGGSTAGADGIRTAYELAERGRIKEGNNRIILATDGDFNVGISDQGELKGFIEKKRNDGIFMSTMGFGMGNYHDNTMQTLAQNGNGNAAYIDNLNEARKVLVEEAGATLFTIAKDVKIQVEFNPALVQEYRLIGYETRHLNREDFNNDKIDAGEIGSGHAVTAIYEVTPVGATASVDNLRYAAKEKAAVVNEEDKSTFSNELAFLKIRYKQPDGTVSKLMTRPITAADEQKFDALPDDIRFAAAVAGFGQLLRENKYTGSLTWDQVIEMANSARGKDEFGYRTEFVNLVRLAKSEASSGGQR
ncbi:MAG: von Willebrand factor type A domain-containing protein [Alphaproteobacteria bacterium]